MRKTHSFLRFLFLFSLLVLCMSVGCFASEVPDDAFDGNFASYESSDGSVTMVYDNGCVITEHPDGSKTGVDYAGNQHEKSADGTYSVRSADGTVATEFSDGTRMITEASGSSTVYYPDGSYTETSAAFGTVIEYDAEGTAKSIGFAGSDEKIKADEDGYYVGGSITGPNGATMEVSDNGISLTSPDGKKVEYSYSAGKESVSIKHPDGSAMTSESNVSWTTDENGNRCKKVESETHIDMSDGTVYDGSNILTYDENGRPAYSVKNVEQYTSPDGSAWWIDRNSSAMDFSAPNGDIFYTDKNGNLLKFKTKDIDWKVTYDDNGEIVSARITMPDGTSIVQAPDGTREVITPEGGYVISAEGEVTITDGTPSVRPDQYRYDYHGETSDSYFSGSTQTVPGEVSVPTEGLVPTVDDIVGTYHFCGMNYYLNEEQVFDYTFASDDQWPQKIVITDISEWEGDYDESYAGSYDPRTGIVYCSMPKMFFVFTYNTDFGVDATVYMYFDGLIFQGTAAKQ